MYAKEMKNVEEKWNYALVNKNIVKYKDGKREI